VIKVVDQPPGCVGMTDVFFRAIIRPDSGSIRDILRESQAAMTALPDGKSLMRDGMIDSTEYGFQIVRGACRTDSIMYQGHMNSGVAKILFDLQ
jgi:hypothetical protein